VAHEPEHGVVVAQVPWARAGSGFTCEFEDQCGWLAVHTSRTAVSALMRVAWRTVGRIVERLTDEGLAGTDLLANLRRIGIDELSYRKGHKYLTVVVDHDSGRLVWMQPGRDAATVHRFFDALGPERSAALELVSADGALWIEEAVAKRAPQAVRCLDPFHVVQGRRPKPSIRSAASSGTGCAEAVSRSRPGISRGHAGHCGRTPRI
jgi:transposase